MTTTPLYSLFVRGPPILLGFILLIPYTTPAPTHAEYILISIYFHLYTERVNTVLPAIRLTNISAFV
jgi:hypothetical protein